MMATSNLSAPSSAGSRMRLLALCSPRQSSAQLHRRPSAGVGAAAGLLLTCVAPFAHAGTIYKCVGDDIVPAYVSQRIKGEHCVVVSHYDSPSPSPRPQPSRVAPPARTSDGQAGVLSSTQGISTSVPRASTSVPVTAPPLITGPASPADIASAGHVTDFGDPNAAAVLARLNDRNGSFRYVQIGDSHTAGDYLTGELRDRLQQRMGNGGIGWAMPMSVPGQRLAKVNFDVAGWALINSRSQTPADYPFGGLIAQVVSGHAMLTVKSKGDDQLQAVTAIIRQRQGDDPLRVADADGRQQTVASPAADGQWHEVTFQARLPLTVMADHSPGTAIGGWWFSSTRDAGAVVSAVGINGSEQWQWDRWRQGWMQDLMPGQPDMIAIAYGTNEAFNRTLDANAVRTDLEGAIDSLRQRFPQAAVLIIGAPESLVSRSGACGRRAPNLDAVQQVQKDVAKNRRTLYWDWQQAMGGTCSMAHWLRNGLGRGDGVHFSVSGYNQLGDDLYQGLVGLAQNLAGGSVSARSVGSSAYRPR